MRFSGRWRCGSTGTTSNLCKARVFTESFNFSRTKSQDLSTSPFATSKQFSMMYQPEIERISEELYFIAASPATRRLRTQAELLSQTDVPVLITGEAGSGKTTAARLIHSLSIRSSFPFMRVKCAVLTSDLLENELFGYEHASADGRPESTPGNSSSAPRERSCWTNLTRCRERCKDGC